MLSSAAIGAVHGRVRELLPGLIASVVVAAAATFLSEHYGAPVMLFALLLGMSMNFLSTQDRCQPGIEFAAREVLRIGVALLGIRITIGQIAALGWRPIALVIATVVITILTSIAVARVIGFRRLFGLLTGGATAICGASAALALAAALPAHPQKERATLFTVIGVSTLSTLAMIIYPMIVNLLDLGPQAAGVFIGATIHDVAQVVGAGYAISQETGDTATVVKLMRIAMLLPVIVCAALITRASGAGAPTAQRPPLLPWFAAAFIGFVALNSTGWVAPTVRELGGDASRWCLVIAICAIGMKTELKQIVSVGFRPIALMIGETVFLAALVLALMRWAF